MKKKKCVEKEKKKKIKKEMKFTTTRASKLNLEWKNFNIDSNDISEDALSTKLHTKDILNSSANSLITFFKRSFIVVTLNSTKVTYFDSSTKSRWDLTHWVESNFMREWYNLFNTKLNDNRLTVLIYAWRSDYNIFTTSRLVSYWRDILVVLRNTECDSYHRRFQSR